MKSISRLIEEENLKYEKKERNRKYPITIVLETKEEKNEYICNSRGEFRSTWNSLINREFGFINEPEFESDLIRKYGEGVFNETKKIYIIENK